MPERHDLNAPPWAATLIADVRDVRKKQDELCEKQDEMNVILSGGSKPADGLVVKVDRLEQREESRKNWTGIAVGAGIAGLVTGILSLIFTGKWA